MIIEVKNAAGEFVAYCISKKGELDCCFQKRSPVLPMDKIIYHNADEIKNTSIQTDKLHELLCNARENIKRVIKRNGDLNILVEMMDKVVSIMPNGWVLDFANITEVTCSQDEIFLIPEKLSSPKQVDIQKLQKMIKVGDKVEAWYGKELITGEIVHAYGLDKEILNINFDNNTKQTAIGRQAVIKIIA